MKILFLPKHEYMGASSRYRTLQYLPYIEENNMDFDVSPLFSDEYLKFKYKHGKENKIITFKRILNRIQTILFKASTYDVLVIEKELIPYFPAILEWYLKLKKIPYIVDYDDAVWHNYDLHRKSIVKFLFKNKIRYVIKNAQCIVTGSEYIVDYAKYANARNIVKIPTVIDLEKYICTDIENKDKFIVGWIGSPSSSKYILELNTVLKEFTDKYNATVHLVGFDKKLSSQLLFNNKIIDWTEESEVKEINYFDVGIMPLPDTPFERGKCGFKLIQYMGCKKPVIATPVGENKIIVESNINGFLANNDKEWLIALEKLYKSKELCRSMGENAYIKINNFYSLDIVKNKYINTIKEIHENINDM